MAVVAVVCSGVSIPDAAAQVSPGSMSTKTSVFFGGYTADSTDVAVTTANAILALPTLTCGRGQQGLQVGMELLGDENLGGGDVYPETTSAFVNATCVGREASYVLAVEIDNNPPKGKNLVVKAGQQLALTMGSKTGAASVEVKDLTTGKSLGGTAKPKAYSGGDLQIGVLADYSSNFEWSVPRFKGLKFSSVLMDSKPLADQQTVASTLSAGGTDVASPGAIQEGGEGFAIDYSG